jgi:hypothetical protein
MQGLMNEKHKRLYNKPETTLLNIYHSYRLFRLGCIQKRAFFGKYYLVLSWRYENYLRSNYLCRLLKIEHVKKVLILAICCVTISAYTSAQKGWEAGGWIGGSYYFGDLNTNYDLSDPGLAAGLIVRHNFNNRLSIRAGASYAQLGADDANSSNAFERARNLSFQTDVIDGSFALEFNFLPYIHGSKDHFFTPYLFAGFNIFHFNPKAEYEGELVELRPLGTEGQFRGEEYYSVSGGWVYGLGIKLDITYELSLNIEVSARSLFTDYLDDVSTVYPDKQDLLKLRDETAVALSDRSVEIDGVNSSQIGLEGTQRGNSNNNDSFVLFGIGLSYFFGDIRCPEYSRYK